MSSPGASLKKTKKAPLPGSRSVPFRSGLKPGASQEPIRGEVAGASSQVRSPEILDSATQSYIMEGIRRRVAKKAQPKSSAPPSDADLLGSMATRLVMVERELLAAKREVIEKDQYVYRLEERLAVLERARKSGCGSGEGVRELEMKCLALQRQVDEMEEFLNDYGMVWVGGHQEGRREEGEGEEGGGVWVPRSSVVSEEQFSVDFDLILRNIEELNVLAGEGSSTVTRTETGAKLKPPDPIPLTLYKNGLVMFSGPFRPYCDPTTQQLVADLTDGYFPSELQSRFPDGVPMLVHDERGVVFRVREYRDYFPGAGHQLGGLKQPSRLLPSSQDIYGQGKASELPGHKLSLEKFLSHLPNSVVHGGRVIDIRSGVAEALQGGEGPGSSVTLVETPVLQEIKSRLNLEGEPRPPTPGHVCTLRVKSECGDETFVLKMRHSDTVADIRRHIDHLRPPDASRDYLLKSSFPNRQTFSDLTLRLCDCGLVPSANLFMVRA